MFKKNVAIAAMFMVTSCYTKHYLLAKEPIDIVMPCHPKDLDTLELCIQGIKENVINHRRIIVVSESRLTNNAEWIDERIYPFDKKSIAQEIFSSDHQANLYLNDKWNRAGWIFKQLTNLYHFRVIPGLSSNILVIDCDTIFLRPVSFLDKDGNGLYNPGTEYYEFYFIHAAKIIPGFKKMFSEYSGISHHMLFQRPIMADLLDVIEKNSNLPAWKAICRAIDKKEAFRSPMADYEIYFNFAFSQTDQVKIRKLKWLNTSVINPQKFKTLGYDYISCHQYLRI